MDSCPHHGDRKDHQGGGKGRVARWDGTKFVPQTDWFSANQDLVWTEIKKYSEESRSPASDVTGDVLRA